MLPGGIIQPTETRTVDMLLLVRTFISSTPSLFHLTDSEFVESFLLTFSSFMSPVELMDALIAR